MQRTIQGQHVEQELNVIFPQLTCFSTKNQELDKIESEDTCKQVQGHNHVKLRLKADFICPDKLF